MTCAISLNKDLNKQIQKVVKIHMQKIIRMSTDKYISKDRAIHQIRRRFKKLRSILHLLRYDLTETFFDKQNRLYKSYAKNFSSLRDQKVLIDVYFSIIRKYELEDTKYIQILESIQEPITEIEISDIFKRVYLGISDNLKNIKDYKFDKNTGRYFLKCVRKTYKQTKKLKNIATNNGDDADFHLWRKWVNYHWYQLHILQNSDTNRKHMLKQLANILGDIHDITIFKEFLLTTKISNIDKFLMFLNKEQDRLKQQAITIGDELFDQKAKELF
ncbi:CHAD domain-containing protein [Arcobacter sp. FWKO B]|uniref:CHAD domain-containing protein n=1 Tax=Arcobacter sp. FWKO B TaxID=2593672 RepID=UPI001907A943|nr:CHAD domain-containing protein [Arcobacter sp. FWKO B]